MKQKSNNKYEDDPHVIELRKKQEAVNKNIKNKDNVSFQDILNSFEQIDKIDKEITEYKKNKEMKGTGFFTRDVGRLPPSVRKLLEEVKDEKITSITVWREPLSYSKLAKIFNIKMAYDDIFHLALNINNRYNLEKDGVIIFQRGTPKGEQKEASITKEITIGELFEKTRKKMGDSSFTSYDARKNNCQDFVLVLLSVLETGSELKDFVKQDTKKIFTALPNYVELLGKAVNTVKQVVDRQFQGEGQQAYNFQYPRCKILK